MQTLTKFNLHRSIKDHKSEIGLISENYLNLLNSTSKTTKFITHNFFTKMHNLKKLSLGSLNGTNIFIIIILRFYKIGPLQIASTYVYPQFKAFIHFSICFRLPSLYGVAMYYICRLTLSSASLSIPLNCRLRYIEIRFSPTVANPPPFLRRISEDRNLVNSLP